MDVEAYEILNGMEIPVVLEIRKHEFIAQGTFGSVFKAHILLKSNPSLSGDNYAIKQIKNSPQTHGRELDILKNLHHPNIVYLRFYFESHEDSTSYTNLVFEHVTTNLHILHISYISRDESFPILSIKIVLFQLFRGLAYLHHNNVCHRDIKPDNLMVDTPTFTLKIGDFGSAIKIGDSQKHISYICSRYYRAPELILGSRDYSFPIDIWSTGCVLAELMLGKPLFVASTSVDLFCEICKFLGTPEREDLLEMNKEFGSFNFPKIEKYNMVEKFPKEDHQELVEILLTLLVYRPSQRIDAKNALCHKIFKDLVLNCALHNLQGGNYAPDLVNFTSEEISYCPQLMDLKEAYYSTLSYNL